MTIPETTELAPVEKLWRLKGHQRREAVRPFIGQSVIIDRWAGRVADLGDQQYKGTLVTVAISTVGTAADFLILQTVDGTVWAISAAQVAYLQVAPRPRRS